MSVSRLPSGRWRAQINQDGRNVSVPSIIGGPKSYATKREAKAAREKARLKLGGLQASCVTVREFWERWTTDPLYQRPKEATMLFYQARTKLFVDQYGDLPLGHVSSELVGEWIAGGRNGRTVPALRAMFSDAASAKAGRLVSHNPFARLGLKQSKGNSGVDPPSERTVRELIRVAGEIVCPSYAGWLQTACFTGMRPGEIDALKWDHVDLDDGWINVREQINALTGSTTAPKNGCSRLVPLTPEARAAIVAQALVQPRPSEFVFVNMRGEHWSRASRPHHWDRVRAEVGYTGSLYLATRHFAGWYMTNVLELPSEDVAIMLGHRDGGELVRLLYGHRSTDLALQRVRNAYEARGTVSWLRLRERPHIAHGGSE